MALSSPVFALDLGMTTAPTPTNVGKGFQQVLMTPGTFVGRNVFGDPGSLSWTPLVGNPASIDAFLGNSPGTTVYGVPASGHAVGVQGTFIAASAAGCTSQQNALTALSLQVGELVLPTADPHVGATQSFTDTYFQPAEYVASSAGILSYPGSQNSLDYKIVFRQVTR